MFKDMDNLVNNFFEEITSMTNKLILTKEEKNEMNTLIFECLGVDRTDITSPIVVEDCIDGLIILHTYVSMLDGRRFEIEDKGKYLEIHPKKDGVVSSIDGIVIKEDGYISFGIPSNKYNKMINEYCDMLDALKGGE